METPGYPQLVIVWVLGLGIPLALLRPYAAFLFAVLLLTAGHFHMFNQTRLAALGPYLNLNDACVLVALAALFFDKAARKGPVVVPHVVALMFAVLIIACVQSFWQFGPTYVTMRSTRWVFEFPLAIFLGANLVTTRDRARKLIAALLAGAVLAAGQHLFFVVNTWRSKSLSMETYSAMRTIGYLAGCMGPAFLLSSVVWKTPSRGGKQVLAVATGLLLIASILMNQTRSLWLGIMGSVPCLLLLFRSRYAAANLLRFTVMLGLTFAASMWLLQRAMPGLDVAEIGLQRLSSLALKSGSVSGTGTRRRAFEVEMDSYLKGTLIFGRGIAFFQAVENSDDPSRRVAFGHLAYVSYLSHLGFIGLLVYGFYLPFGILRDGLWLWRTGDEPSCRYLALLGVASIVCFSIVFLATSGFLGVGAFAPAVLYGAVWALARAQGTGSSPAAPGRVAPWNVEGWRAT